MFGGRAYAITDKHIPPLELGLGFPCAAILSVSFFHKGEVDYVKTPIPPPIPPFPPNWDYYQAFPVPVGYFEDVFQPDFWDHARKYGTEATRMGPKTLGSRIAIDQGEHRDIVWSPEYDLIPDESVVITNSMRPEEERAANMENLRRARAHRISTGINYSLQQTLEAHDTTDAMDVDELGDMPPDHFITLGKNFDTLSAIDTEFSHSVLPPSPRYEEIRNYLLANRAQGRLCLDTMAFYIPAYRVLHYIQDFGGISITPDEWIAFLGHCSDRNESF